MWLRRMLLVVAGIWSLGCGNATTPSEPAPGSSCPPPARSVGNGCIEPGVDDDGCAAGTNLLDGACVGPGVPVNGCSEGFVHDGDGGCTAILPSARCGPGTMAIVGETSCHSVMSCGAGPWGDIPVDAATVFVDAGAPGPGDGSQANPFTALSDAVAAAAPGSLVAVAAGSYNDAITIAKPLRIHGVCPDMVALTQPSNGASVTITSSGVELHGLSITGGGIGVLVVNGADIVLDRLWIHDTAFRGMGIQNTLGPPSVRITDSLLENFDDIGIFLGGASAVIERSVVRGAQRGVAIQVPCVNNVCDAAARSNLTMRACVVEDNREHGMYVAGSDVDIEATLVRGTVPLPGQPRSGRGIELQLVCFSGACDPNTRATGRLHGVVVESNYDVGVRLRSADATIETTTVRDTRPGADGLYGRGLAVEWPCAGGVCQPGEQSQVSIDQSKVAGAYDLGILLAGATAVIDRSYVRDVLTRTTGGDYGGGISAQVPCTMGVCDVSFPASMTLQRSVVAATHNVGVTVRDSQATIDTTLISGTMPISTGAWGNGLVAISSCPTCPPVHLDLQHSRVEWSSTSGLTVHRARANVFASQVDQTSPQASNDLFGDGILVAGGSGVGNDLELLSSSVTNSARAGVALLGARGALGQSNVQCAAFELAGDDYDGLSFALADLGEVHCGCPTADHACQLVSTGLEAPEPPQLVGD